MKRCLLLLICLSLLSLSGCATRLTRYEAVFTDVFDTVTTLTGYAASEAAFEQTAEACHALLRHYHRLFDAYNAYDGMENVYSINMCAGKEPLTVDPELTALLLFSRDMAKKTQGAVDVTLGAVTRLWHDARYGSHCVPERETLLSAAAHTGQDKLLLDAAANTVFLTDPDARLDVGAVAKGWAAQKAAEALPGNMLLSIGGNVIATGPNPETGKPWRVGVKSPDGSGYAQVRDLAQGCMVTSGDYERAFEADGVRYGHIISPYTLEPPRLWRSVTVIAKDSAVADALSTALFILPESEGRAIAAAFGAEIVYLPMEE